MKILHIANWYPSRPTPFSAYWIRNHIKSLSDHVSNKIYHIEIRKGSLKILVGKNGDGSSYYLVYFPTEIWRLYEVIGFVFVLLVVIRNSKREFDAINFHIAYPNCTYLKIIKKLVNKPLIITEHWSAYHYDFNIKNPQKRKRIQNIFHHNIPVITVSRSLLEDIQRFSKTSFPGFIIPNIVNTDIFTYHDNLQNQDKVIFFAVSQWKWPKNPFLLLKVWKTLQDKKKNIHLIIGGYGPQWREMVKLSEELGLLDSIELRGKMDQQQIAYEMNRATAFIHISEYETFSVVCAEALCCGTPVIASNVGGIKELIDDQNGILVENEEIRILEALDYIIKNKKLFKKEDICTTAINTYNEKNIGNQYYEIIREIIDK